MSAEKKRADIVRIDRCNYCDGDYEYIVRSDTVNSGLSDTDIEHIVTNRGTHPQYQKCGCCHLVASVTTVAWRGINHE